MPFDLCFCTFSARRLIILAKVPTNDDVTNAFLKFPLIAGSRQRKSATQKDHRKSADLRGRIAVSHFAWRRPVESISTGGRPSGLEK